MLREQPHYWKPLRLRTPQLAAQRHLLHAADSDGVVPSCGRRGVEALAASE